MTNHKLLITGLVMIAVWTLLMARFVWACRVSRPRRLRRSQTHEVKL